jgi:hypothetical protein
MSDNDTAIMDKALQGKTRTIMKNAPGWVQELASDSEAIVLSLTQ